MHIWPKYIEPNRHLVDRHLVNIQFAKRVGLLNIWPIDIFLSNRPRAKRHWTDRHWITRYWANRCLANVPLKNRHLRNTHLTKRHLVNRHLANRHLANRHLETDIWQTGIWPTDIWKQTFGKQTFGHRTFGHRTFSWHTYRSLHDIYRSTSIFYWVDQMSFVQRLFDQKTLNSTKLEPWDSCRRLHSVNAIKLVIRQ